MTSSKTLVSCTIIFLTYVFIVPVTCSSNETDLLALLDFKARIELDPLGSLTSWNQTTHFCTWNGIRCGRLRPYRAVAINLVSQGLVGSLSPQIGNLSFLTTLFLRNNTFRGQIPREISLLSRLESIDLSNNSFTGPIPGNISQCSNLVSVNLIDNKLSGAIPPEFGLMNNLKLLYLSKNNFIGTIPPSLGNLTSLEILSLGICGLEGEIPESLINLKRLIYFNVGVNSLTGNVPLGLFNMSDVYIFAIHVNQLEGEIPSDLGLTLPSLEQLYLGGNRFTGMIPPSLSNASNLEVIVLLRNNFTGPMPNAGKLSHLRGFTAAVNPIQDDISFITSFINCTNLTYLQIGDNFLTGLLPNTIGNLSHKLEELAISNTQIHGNIPSSIVNLVGLTEIQLLGNFLDGHFPLDIGKLGNLRRIDFEENDFTNELPSSFRNLTRLFELNLRRNNFSGTMHSLSNCSNLITLDLSYNNFNGQIPLEILNLESISVKLDLSGNAFSGSIPSEVGSLSNLADLDFSNNRLSGFVPNALGECTSLQRLHLEGNSLGGEIPSGLRELLGLQDLDLSRNNFSGPIPMFLSTIRFEKLNLSYNRLQGEVPMRGIFANITAISLDGNSELCGGIIELDFPRCSFSSKRRSFTLLKKILIPCACILFLISLGLTMFLYHQKTHKKTLSSMPTFSAPFIRLSYADLAKATDGFSSTNLIGAGRFGTVYKGVLEDGQTLIAVKVLDLSVRGASKSFVAECNALRGLRHRNLVKILSVCESIDFQQNDFKAIVYDLKVNGSLEKWLYHEVGRGNNETDAESRRLSVFQRLEIAIDVAHGLEYLHYGMESSAVHGDLKPSNILLDHDLKAFVGDFGLAKVVSSMNLVNDSNSSVLIKGTIGYIAPEYATSYTVSTQGDVYSYGILLLEMFTNIRPTDEAFEDHFNLHNFVSNALQNNVMEIVDPLIRVEHETNDKIVNCMVSMLSIGVKCSRTVPNDRVVMTDVVNELRKVRNLYTQVEDRAESSNI